MSNSQPSWPELIPTGTFFGSPGYIRRGDQFRGSFHIVGSIDGEETRQALCDALVAAIAPAMERVQRDRASRRLDTAWKEPEVSVWFPRGDD